MSRLLLAAWEVGLWGLVGTATALMTLAWAVADGGWDLRDRLRGPLWKGWLTGLVLGGLLAFAAHETLFPRYARLIGVEECWGPGCVVGETAGYLPELERWTGPTR